MMFKMTNNIRENNTLLVLTEITNNPGISRAMISEVTGLNKATISEIVRKLIEDNYVIETGSGKSTSSGGRKPILLTINNKAGISVSFDVRYDCLSYLITYLDGEKIEYVTKDIELNMENVVDIIADIVDETKVAYSKIPFGVIGVTISIHGIVNNNAIEFTPYFDIDKLALVEILEERLDLPVYIENEANLTALAESAFDSVHNNLISLSAHTGIGAGIILDGKLYRGYRGRSGEIGHTILHPDGLACPCGNKGCLEQYCSPKVILKDFQATKSNRDLTLKDLATAYYQNDTDAIELVRKFVEDFGIGLMNVIGNYDPEIIYINSEIVEEMPELIDRLNHFLSLTIYKKVQLKRSMLGNKASLYGATVMNLKEFLRVDNVDFNFDMSHA